MILPLAIALTVIGAVNFRPYDIWSHPTYMLTMGGLLTWASAIVALCSWIWVRKQRSS